MPNLAGIDLGSNSLRISIVHRLADGGDEELDAGRAAVRLADDAFGDGVLGMGTRMALTASLSDFAGRMDRFAVTAYRAVGTEAFRLLRDVGSLQAKIEAKTGLQVEVLPVEEEARLVAEAVTATLRDGPRPELIVDLGGGSLDLVLTGAGPQGGPSIESHSLGLASRFDDFLSGRPDDLETRRALWREAHRLGDTLPSDLLEHVPQGTRVALAGGQAAMLDRLAEGWGLWNPEGSAGTGIEVSQFGALQQQVLGRSAEELVRLGIPPDRASMLAAAGALYGAIALRVFCERIRIPRVGLMDGLLAGLPESGRVWGAKE